MKFMMKLNLLLIIAGSFFCGGVTASDNFSTISISVHEGITVPTLQNKKDRFSNDMQSLEIQYNSEQDDQIKKAIVADINNKRDQSLIGCNRPDAIQTLQRDDICCHHIPNTITSILCCAPAAVKYCVCGSVCCCISLGTGANCKVNIDCSYSSGFERAKFNGRKAIVIVEKDMIKQEKMQR